MQSGKDITIIGTGGIIVDCLKAADLLKENGLSAQVISMHSIKPLDEECIKECAKNNKKIITVEEHNKIGGLGSAVSEIIAQNNLNCSLKLIALEDTFSSVVGSQEFLRNFYKLDSKTIFKEALKLIEDV